jgi:chemotaxis protein MotB
MRNSVTLLLLSSALLLGGCASQETLDSQLVAINRQLDEMKQGLASLSESQQQQGAHLARLESQGDTRMARLEDGNAKLREDLKRELEAMRDRVAANQSSSATQQSQDIQALSGKIQAASATDAQQSQDIQAMGEKIAKVDDHLQKLVAGTIDQATRSAQFQSAQEQLAKRVDTQAAALQQTTEMAEDAIKIARDSRKVSGKIIHRLELNNEMVLFDYERPDLSASGKAALDELVAKVKPELPHVFIEIIGHSDDVSLSSINYKIAEDRAKSVERYLHEVGDIPLHRMSIISYGHQQPIDVGNTLQSRSRNRRVTVQVLK